MQGNLGRSFYRELSWSVMARATPSLFSSRVPTVRIFWQVLLARQGWLHWKMPQVGCNIHGLVRSEMIFSLARWSHVISSQCVLDGDGDDNDAAAFWTWTCLDNFLSLFDCLRRSVTRCLKHVKSIDCKNIEHLVGRCACASITCDRRHGPFCHFQFWILVVCLMFLICWHILTTYDALWFSDVFRCFQFSFSNIYSSWLL